MNELTKNIGMIINPGLKKNHLKKLFFVKIT